MATANKISPTNAPANPQKMEVKIAESIEPELSISFTAVILNYIL